MGRRRQRPRRQTSHNMNLVLEKKNTTNHNDSLRNQALQEIGENELWQIDHGKYFVRVIDNLNNAFIPSRESFDRLESIGIFDSKKAERNYFDYIGYPDVDEEWQYFEIFNEIKEKAENGDKESQKDLINSLDNYHAEYDDALKTIVAVANDKSVNANGTGGEPIGFQYTIYFEGREEGENAFQDGILVKPTKIIAIYDNDREQNRYLTALELQQIKFNDKGEQPNIYQLEGMK